MIQEPYIISYSISIFIIMHTIHKKIGLALCAFALCATPAFAATDDMAHYWNFEEGMGRSVGDSVGGQNGALTGSSTGFGWAGGKVGASLAMDGMEGEGVALPNGFLTGSQGSISVWLAMTELSDSNIIFSGRSTTDRYTYASLSIDRDGRPLFQFRDTVNGNDRRAQGTRLIGKNEWVHVVLTANGQGYRMFVNGEAIEIAGDNIGRWFPDLTNQVFMYRIGTADAATMNGSFRGYLDDLRIYSRALSAEEAAALFEVGNAAAPTLPAGIAPKLSFGISASEVPFGGSVALNWSTQLVDTCTASGGWNGAMATSGTQVMVKLANDVSYQLVCGNKYGTVQETVRVHVLEKGATSTAPVSTGGSLTVTDVTPTPSTATAERQAMIDKLVAQIMILIGELQKKIAEMQAAGAR